MILLPGIINFQDISWQFHLAGCKVSKQKGLLRVVVDISWLWIFLTVFRDHKSAHGPYFSLKIDGSFICLILFIGLVSQFIFHSFSLPRRDCIRKRGRDPEYQKNVTVWIWQRLFCYIVYRKTCFTPMSTRAIMIYYYYETVLNCN